MKKIIFLFLVLFLFISFSVISSADSSLKHEFVYKAVNGHAIKANIFLPETEGLFPVFVFFHGGYFFGNRDQGLHNNLKDKLIDSGYAVVSVDYRLAPETKLSGILEDVRDIVKWIRKNGKQEFNLDVNKIVAAGCSAGGYMAFTTGFIDESAPDAIVAISAPTGFSTAGIKTGDISVLQKPGPYDIVQNSVVSYGDYDKRLELFRFLAKNNLALYELFGFDPVREPERLDKYRLTTNIGSHYPPALLIHSKNDRLVGPHQVNDLHVFLEEKKIENELYLVENGHGNTLLDQNPDVIEKIIHFLDNRLKNSNIDSFKSD